MCGHWAGPGGAPVESAVQEVASVSRMEKPKVTFTSVLEDFLLGSRRGFGDGRVAIRIASTAAARRPINWMLPGLMGLFMILYVVISSMLIGGGNGFGYMVNRIIAVDYMVFFFGWVCGWNSAWRWRGNQSFIEELVMTNIRPAVGGNLLFAGSLGIWWRVLLGLSLVDMILLVVVPGELSLIPGDSVMVDGVVFAAILMVSFPVFLLLAWFHLETLRIAYWMFAVAALPQVKLLNKAIVNAFLVSIYVLMLTAVGSMITGIVASVLGVVVVSTVRSLSYAAAWNLDPFAVRTAWIIGAVPGLILVAFLKRQIVSMYETAFCRSWLLFCWYGAAETQHPMIYPNELQQQVGPWIRYLQLEERGK